MIDNTEFSDSRALIDLLHGASNQLNLSFSIKHSGEKALDESMTSEAFVDSLQNFTFDARNRREMIAVTLQYRAPS